MNTNTDLSAALNMARWRKTQRDRLWLLVPCSLVALWCGAAVVWILLKILLATGP